MPLRFTPSSSLVRQALTGHSWLGLMAGALMYLVCLSGTLAVFYEELERWEQPYVEEFEAVDPGTAEAAFNTVVGSGIEVTPHMWLVLPTDSVPRLRIATESESWFLNSDGSIGQRERNQWTEALIDLHLWLHLPESWGMIVVSALGAILVALIISGVIAHPRMFRDAFTLRANGSRHLEQADIHNRLSVWGLPFHLMIAVTGAWFGLALPMLAVVAEADYEGDREAVVAAVFGDEPELHQTAGPLAIARGLQKVRDIAPDARPFLLTAHDVGTPGQFFSISARHPGRLIYSENYLFDSAGRFLGTQGFADGATGKQLLYSIYRLHFGHFGGLPVKLAYGLLGLVLTVVAVTGMNVWLARRRTRDVLNRLWPAVVWGAPVALAVSAFAQVVLDFDARPVLWLALSASALLGLRLQSEKALIRLLQLAFAATAAVLVAAYGLRYGAAAATPAALAVNAVLLGLALAIGALAWRPGRRRRAACLDP